MNITLNGNKLPWVKQVKHLGPIIQSDNSMSIDIAQKRAGFIAKMNSILQEFHFVNSETLVKLMYSYATTMYGSNTWDLFSKDCEKLYRSFNVAIRHVFNLHRQTHRYFIESITQSLHLDFIDKQIRNFLQIVGVISEASSTLFGLHIRE